MRRILLAALLALGGCSPDPGTRDGGEDSDGGGGGNDAGTQARWTIQSLSDGTELADFDIALAPDGRVGIAWFHRIDTRTYEDEPDYELRYLEWNDGQVGPPETIGISQRLFGLDLAFQENGQPMIAYLGGKTPLEESVFWHQSDAAIARRNANGIWTEEIVAVESNEAPAGNPVSDQGYLVGLFPALAVDGSKTYLAWRDCHFGNTEMGDWNGSDIEMAVGASGSWSKSVVVAGGNDKQAWGGHLQMVIAGGQPALVSDQIPKAPGGAGQNVIFNRRRADGTWSAPVRPFDVVANTQSGPSMDWDPTLGFAIAVVDRNASKLMFSRSIDEGATWTEPYPVYQRGTGGWYPSLSINPVTHEPSIAFYVCSNKVGVAETSCDAEQLVVAERISNVWREETVDPEGAWKPKVEHRADGRRVIVYRDPQSAAIKLAVEK